MPGSPDSPIKFSRTEWIWRCWNCCQLHWCVWMPWDRGSHRTLQEWNSINAFFFSFLIDGRWWLLGLPPTNIMATLFHILVEAVCQCSVWTTAYHFHSYFVLAKCLSPAVCMLSWAQSAQQITVHTMVNPLSPQGQLLANIPFYINPTFPSHSCDLFVHWLFPSKFLWINCATNKNWQRADIKRDLGLWNA